MREKLWEKRLMWYAVLEADLFTEVLTCVSVTTGHELRN